MAQLHTMRMTMSWRQISLALGLMALASISTTGHAAKAPTSIEVPIDDIARGRDGYAVMIKANPLYANDALQAYVASVGARLARGAPPINVALRFAVIDSQGIFAYSFADGQIIVSRGMLAHLNSEHDLAAVLAHEIGHIVSLHQTKIWRQIRSAMELEAKLGTRFSSQQAREMLGALSLARVRGYNREHEVEADEWSERLLKIASYPKGSVAAMLRFLAQYDTFIDAVGFQLWELPEDNAGGQGVFATHPSSAARLELAAKRERIDTRATALSDDNYLERLRGMTFGLAERYGVKRGALFVNATHSAALTLPDGWYVFGNDDEIIAAPSDNMALLRIRASARTGKESLHEAMQRVSENPAIKTEPLLTGKLKGEIATVVAKDNTEKTLHAVLDIGDERLFFVGLVSSAETWLENEPHFRAILTSVRLPSQHEIETQPLRIGIGKAPDAGPVIPAPALVHSAQAQTELLNQLFPGGRVAAGQLIKTVQ